MSDPLARAKTDMRESYERDIPDTIRLILSGRRLRSLCGPHLIERHGDGVFLSRTVAEWVVGALGKGDCGQ